MPKEITLSRGHVALVDDEDHKWLSKWNWHASHDRDGTIHARRTVNFLLPDGTRSAKAVWMHREILGLTADNPMQADHIDGDGLNNRRTNLRSVSRRENMRNRRLQANNKSGVPGVSWSTTKRRWRASIRVEGARVELGYFRELRNAAQARREAEQKHHGEFSRNYKG